MDILKFIFFQIICILILKVHFTVAPAAIQKTAFNGIPEIWADDVDLAPFERIGNKYYYFETRNKADWFKAAHICRTLRGNLATIESNAEFVAITDYIHDKRFDSSNFYWLAYNDLSKEGEFYSIATGLRMKFNRFMDSNPDNTYGNENCVHIWYLRGEYSMNDLDCKAPSHYICEADIPKTIAFTVW